MRIALRRGLFFSLLLALTAPFISCDTLNSGDNGGNGIEFPSEGSYGPNLLTGELSTVSVNKAYSLAAKTDADAELTLVFPDADWNYNIRSREGWTSERAEWYLPEETEGDVQIFFDGSDSVEIEVYQNAATPSGSPDRTIQLNWEAAGS